MSDEQSRPSTFLTAVHTSRWPVAILTALIAHALVVVSWIGFGFSRGASFGSDGVHVGLAIAPQLDDTQTTDFLEESLPDELEMKQFEEPMIEPHNLIEQMPPEIPSPDFQSISNETRPLSIPTVEVPLAVLELTPPYPFQSNDIQGSGPGSSDQVGSSERVSNAYVVRVTAHLNRFKKYPKTSRRAKEEGRAEVAFTIYSEGNVDSIRLSKSSGFKELDEEALRMVRRAAPFPKFPSALRKRGVEDLQIRSSIRFSLKD